MELSAGKSRLDRLVSLFYRSHDELGRFEAVAVTALPDAYQRLLAHEEHMTVAMEAYYESLVDVEVLNTISGPQHYARQIALRSRGDQSIVQYGIMRVDLRCIGPEVRAEIEAQRRPLGRILVRHNILRTIHLDGLWRVEPGEGLCRCLGLQEPATTYGRTAGIDLSGTPAVEVLEIVAPLKVQSDSSG